MIVLLFFQFAIGIMKSVFALQTGQNIDASLIMGYYNHLLHLPQRFFDTMRVGEIISRVNDAVKIRNFVNDVALGIIVNFLIIFFSVSLMFFYYWKLALIILLIIPVYGVLYFVSNHINKKQQRRLMERSADLETQLVESLNSAGTIKRFGLENFANRKTGTSFMKLLRTVYKSGLNGLYIGNLSDLVTGVFTIVLLWAGSYFVIKRELSPGELLSFYALIGYLTTPAATLVSANRNIQDALIAADRLYEIVDLETEKRNAAAVELSKENVGDIIFNNVHFRYGTRTVVFENLNLHIPGGSYFAVVGESGSGKSTLLSLLQNLYPLQSGNISIGGIDIKHASNESLRRLVGVVPQQIDLFAGNIIENIALGDEDPNVERVIHLCHLLGINDFVETLPDHYYTVLSEQGTNLSGGQRQRVAIARAIYRDPQILVLDEATSSLDPVSEQKVREAIEWLAAQGKTILIIAHRLSTIRHCKQICVLKNGRLIEKGTHDELMKAAGSYSELWYYHINRI
jgi:ATP-binding cassette subfamily B protein